MVRRIISEVGLSNMVRYSEQREEKASFLMDDADLPEDREGKSPMGVSIDEVKCSLRFAEEQPGDSRKSITFCKTGTAHDVNVNFREEKGSGLQTGMRIGDNPAGYTAP